MDRTLGQLIKDYPYKIKPLDSSWEQDPTTGLWAKRCAMCRQLLPFTDFNQSRDNGTDRLVRFCVTCRPQAKDRR